MLAVLAVPVAQTLPRGGGHSRPTGQVAVRPFATVDAYPQQRGGHRDPAALRASSEPEVHLHAESATVMRHGPDGLVLDLRLDRVGAADPLQ